MDKTEFNLELTGLGESKPNQIIKESFEKISSQLIEVIPENKMLTLYLKADRLLNENNRMDGKHIASLILTKVESILPIIESKTNSYSSLNLDNVNSSETLFDFAEICQFYDTDLADRLSILQQNKPDGENYLKSTYLDSLIDFPITGFGFCDSKTKFVELQTEYVYPSTAENLREKAILNQLKRIVESKLQKNQLKNQKNPILVVQFDDLLFRGYSGGSEILLNNEVDKIKSTIHGAFDENKAHNILGVLLTEDFLSTAIFVPNQNITIEPNILSKIEHISQIVN
jgi:hypothetical protein